jgi:chemotaxis protein methyltransferase CheR
LVARNCPTFAAYHELVQKDPVESVAMINSITTNKTAFFREGHHFEYLRDVLLPRIAAGGSGKLRIWSAGCSTGEEAYSIAAVVKGVPALTGWDVRILASDIDTQVLAHAEAAVYPQGASHDVPQAYRHRMFERESPKTERVRQELRDLVTFRRINLIEAPWPVRARFDIIFCRNVTIYFDHPTQELLYSRFAEQMGPGGQFFAGHSENLSWLGDRFRALGGTVYEAGRSSVRPRRASLAPMSQPPRVSLPAPSLRGGWASAPSLRAGSLPAPSQRRVSVQAPSLRPFSLPAPSQRNVSLTAPSRRTVSPTASHPSRAPRHSTRPGVIAQPREVALQAGGVFASESPTIVRTVLGSCVAVCLFDPTIAAGGMNHFMLPGGSDDSVPTRYGSYAMDCLINDLMKLGGTRSRLVAKVFGGAHVLSIPSAVPERNVKFVLDYLNAEGIPLLAKRLGGDQPLVIRFMTHTGKVQLRALTGAEGRKAAEAESDLAATAAALTNNPAAATIF